MIRLGSALRIGAALALAGCASVETASPVSGSVELNLCLYNSPGAPASSGKDRAIAARLGPLFQSVRMASSKNDSENCDLMGEVAHPSVLRPPHIDVHSAHSKKFLMRAVTQNFADWRYDAPLYSAFNKDAPLYAHILAEREPALNEETKKTSPRVPGAAGLPRITSEIDRPKFDETQLVLGEKDIAVVIGVEKYQDLPAADYAAGDARLVKEYLLALGLKERNIQLLIDEKATQSSIKKTLETWLANRVKPESRVVVYYSGHGSPDPATGAAYLVPHDGDPNYLADTGYPLKHMYEKLGALPAAEVVVLLDSCFSGGGGRSVLAKGARPLVVKMGESPLPSKMVVLAATQGAQISTSAAEKGHGLFTYHVLKALRDGKKDIVEIYQHIQPLVEDEAKALNVAQSPSLNPEPRHAQIRFRLMK